MEKRLFVRQTTEVYLFKDRISRLLSTHKENAIISMADTSSVIALGDYSGEVIGNRVGACYPYRHQHRLLACCTKEFEEALAAVPARDSAAAVFLIFKYYPMLNAVLAFKDYNVIKGIWGSPWVGFKHFELFFENPLFWTLVKNTIILSGYLILAGFPIPIVLALMINEIRAADSKVRPAGILCAVFYFNGGHGVDHHAVSGPAAGLCQRGFEFFGLESVNFLGDPGCFVLSTYGPIFGRRQVTAR